MKASQTVDEGEYYVELRAVMVEGDVSRMEDEARHEEVERPWCQIYLDQPDRPDFKDLLYHGPQ